MCPEWSKISKNVRIHTSQTEHCASLIILCDIWWQIGNSLVTNWY